MRNLFKLEPIVLDKDEKSPCISEVGHFELLIAYLNRIIFRDRLGRLTPQFSQSPRGATVTQSGSPWWTRLPGQYQEVGGPGQGPGHPSNWPE